MLVLQFGVVAALTALSLAAPTSETRGKHVVHEKRGAPASDWVKGARIESSAVLPMRIGLTQNNLHLGHDWLMEVSDPYSPKYGQYWSADDVHEKFSPAEETVQAVKDWLSENGIDGSRVVHTDNKGWLAFDATVEEAEDLLKTEYHEHEHRYSSSVKVGCDSYHVPEHIAPHIDYITPGIKLTQVVKRQVKVKRGTHWHQKRANRISHQAAPHDGFATNYQPPNAGYLPKDLQDCGRNITPTCIKALYKIPKAHLALPGHSLGLFEQGDFFAESDIDLFYKKYAPHIPQGTYPIPALVDGANYSVPANSSYNGGEADIDIDMAYSLLYPQVVTLYQTDDINYSEADLATTNLFNTFLDALDGSYCTYSAFGETGNDPAIDPVYPDTAPGGYTGQLQCGVYKPTNVISASYGQAEADLPLNYTMRQCNEFMKLGLQGHSILVSSGDYGVGSFPGDGNPNGCLGPEAAIFNPQYPSGCQYITSVGGSMLYADQTIDNPESVMHVNLSGTAQNFTSAGGFSNYFPQPDYQKNAVAQYFSEANLTYPYYSEFSVNVNTTKGLYNRIGRAYPDVAANGANFRAYTAGNDYYWYGSSLASPLFASVLTLINQERAVAGKGPVGFVNPVLYSHPEILNDVTNGTNVGCGSEGFHAAAGWDPATGLGTPNYPKMLNLWLSLP